jgi:Zn-dependent peptidase ImmA (M78 family)
MEESYPLDLDINSPSEVLREAERIWKDLPSLQRERAEEAVYRFTLVHDLSQALRGIELPPLWLMREGNTMWVDWGGGYGPRASRRQLPLGAVTSGLEAFAEIIIRRFEHISDDRAQYLRQIWSERDKSLSDRQLLKLRTGLHGGELDELLSVVGHGLLREPIQREVLFAAARMTRGLVTPHTIKQMLDRIRTVPSVNIEVLNALSKVATNELHAVADSVPFEQGYYLARWFRGQHGIVGSDQRVRPETILRSWGIEVENFDFGDFTDNLDALAVWGSQNGPHILINSRSGRSTTPSGRTFTLAHEICHLLVDRMSSLPIAEVLGGRSPAVSEKRANAFAAEALLPRRIAAEALAHRSGIASCVKDLANRFGVSEELVSWQIRNSHLGTLSQEEQRYLASLTSNRFSYDSL